MQYCAAQNARILKARSTFTIEASIRAVVHTIRLAHGHLSDLIKIVLHLVGFHPERGTPIFRHLLEIDILFLLHLPQVVDLRLLKLLKRPAIRGKRLINIDGPICVDARFLDVHFLGRIHRVNIDLIPRLILWPYFRWIIAIPVCRFRTIENAELNFGLREYILPVEILLLVKCLLHQEILDNVLSGLVIIYVNFVQVWLLSGSKQLVVRHPIYVIIETGQFRIWRCNVPLLHLLFLILLGVLLLSVPQNFLDCVLFFELLTNLLLASQHFWALDCHRFSRVVFSNAVSRCGFDIGRLTIAHRNVVRSGSDIRNLPHAFTKLLILDDSEFSCDLVLNIKLI